MRQEDNLIDYDQIRSLAREHNPKLIIAGGSAIPRVIDFAAIRAIADEVGAYVLGDVAHFAGLIAAGNIRLRFRIVMWPQRQHIKRCADHAAG